MELVVTVKNGKLRGKVNKNYDGGSYYSFQGIPYAKPPIGALRFKAPLPAESWEGVRDATENGNDCLANNIYISNTPTSDDCLFLNVYTRELPSKSKLMKPVMVWIHGGAFVVGSGSSTFQDPEYLMTKDIIIVTLNYRLGLLGFLSFEDSSLEVPGNAGLKDQVMALKWVQENITHFNGDPNNVTLFGISAGAASVHYLMLSQLTKGLFHKCILQSGCALCPWAQGHKTLPYLTEALEIKTINERQVLEILENMSIKELLQLQSKIPENVGCSFKRCFAPVVEYKSPFAFITETPQDIIKSGNYNHVPFIIGFTSREGTIADFFPNESNNEYVINDFESKIPFTLNIQKDCEHSKAIANKIKTFYYGDHQSCKENSTQFYLVITDNKLEGDTSFVWPIITTLKEHSLVSTVPIYLYRVSVKTNLNYNNQIFKIKHDGVGHGEDMAYLYKNFTSPAIIPNSLEENTIRRFVTMWTNFALSGNPNSPEKHIFLKMQWKPIDQNNLHYLEIGENLTVGVNPDCDRIDFWNKISSINIE